MADTMWCRWLAAVVELISFALGDRGGPGEGDVYKGWSSPMRPRRQTRRLFLIFSASNIPAWASVLQYHSYIPRFNGLSLELTSDSIQHTYLLGLVDTPLLSQKSFTMGNRKYPSHRPAGREHIPHYPKGFIALRFVQLILAVVIIGLCAYSLILVTGAGIALSLFTVSPLATASVTLSGSDVGVN